MIIIFLDLLMHAFKNVKMFQINYNINTAYSNPSFVPLDILCGCRMHKSESAGQFCPSTGVVLHKCLSSPLSWLHFPAEIAL